MKRTLTGRKKRKVKASLPEDTITILSNKNPLLNKLIEVFELEINY